MTLMHYFPFLRDLGPVSLLIRFLTACICGAVIGYSRGRQQRPAGFRTHVLVCLGAASTVIMSQYPEGTEVPKGTTVHVEFSGGSAN